MGVMTSYSNLGGTGDRTGIITIKLSPGFNYDTSTPPYLMLDGTTNPSNTVQLQFRAQYPITVGCYYQFDFPKNPGGAIINEAMTIAMVGYDQGTWQWFGSNDNWVTKTAFGTDRFIGLNCVFTGLSSNTTAYKSYRLQHLNGESSGHDRYAEFQFKICLVDYRHLFQDGNDIKVFSNGIWQKVGEAPATEAMFAANGMPTIALVTDQALASLNNNKVGMLVSSYTTGLSPSLRQIALPAAKFVVSKEDIGLASVQKINQVVANMSSTSGGIAKALISTDSGKTWYTWNDTTKQWSLVDISNLNQAFSDSMTQAVLQSLTSDNWNSLINDHNAKSIKFGYLLSLQVTTDSAKVDSIALTIDMKGRWRNAHNDGSTYDLDYANSNSVDVLLYVSGDYKINY